MIHIAICDDDPAYCEILAFKLEKCMQNKFQMEYELSVCGTLPSLRTHLESTRTDILFLDILLNEQNAMEWSVENLAAGGTQVIFMTAHPEAAYAISETNCCYYLIKPRITEETLARALSRAMQNVSQRALDLTIVKQGGKNHIVRFADIQYIESFNNNITLHLSGRSDITLYTTLKEYGERLPLNFLRCHKCYIVNMNHIAGYEPYKFILSAGICVPIPPKRYKSIVADYKRYLSACTPTPIFGGGGGVKAYDLR